MDIKHHNFEENGTFLAMNEEVEAGRMTYSWRNGDRIVINHTVVQPDFQGKNIGKQLVMAAVDFAREKNIKIVPQCSFARRIFDKEENLRDVL
ncbi:MAG TPA: GNAT family N-acetyltransferase [Cytophagaceae bacterium]|jgi:hypothetical protein